MHRLAILVLGAVFALTPFTAPSANAAYLSWMTVITRQKTYANCMRAAEDGARRTLRMFALPLTR